MEFDDLKSGITGEQISRIWERLAGRMLLWEEIRVLLAPMGIHREADLSQVLEYLAHQGCALRLQGVVADQRGKLVCNRCGQSSSLVQVECMECREECFLCEECIAMGVSRSCTSLWAFPGHDKVRRAVPADSAPKRENSLPVRARLAFPLTKAQRDAAERVLQAVGSSKNDHILIWAACGAGKTEVSFAAIAYTLRQGGRVLFAIPRRDVVLDLEPRLRTAFPGVSLTALYGGCEDRFARGDLVLATTHQVLRLYRDFDLVILDEVDAFPYKDSAMLHFALERARRPQGKLILMTATPDDNLLHEYSKEGKMMLTIPARHHGYPLPEPKIVVTRQIRLPADGKVELPSMILNLIWASVVTASCRLFIFVPRKSLAQRVAVYLRTKLAVPAEYIQHVHAGDPERDEKIRAFKDGIYPILVTTSIMERGVTVSRCNVMILAANTESIFGAGTLIQMSGRAGRTTEYPVGQVWFVGKECSKAMKAAVRRIKALNREAREKGYLND